MCPLIEGDMAPACCVKKGAGDMGYTAHPIDGDDKMCRHLHLFVHSDGDVVVLLLHGACFRIRKRKGEGGRNYLPVEQ